MFKHPTCGGKHSTVAEARACDANEPGTVLTKPMAVDNWATEATDGAKKYLADLLESRDWKGQLGGQANGVIVRFNLRGLIDSRECSTLIDTLKALPQKTPAQPSRTQVADGYYAVVLPGERYLRFFRIKRGKRNPEMIFVSEQASDTFYPVQRSRRQLVLDAIAKAGEETAGKAYAAHLGNCYRCNRTLTDETSRALGIGPVCRDK